MSIRRRRLRRSLPPKYPNLDSQLSDLVEAFEARAYSDGGIVGAARNGLSTAQKDPSGRLTPSGPLDPRDGSSAVDVTIYVTRDIDAVATFLTSNGASVRNMGNSYLEASVPIALLGEASERPGVIRVEPIIGPHLDVIPYPNPPSMMEDAPWIPEKYPQRFANLTSDLDGIAKDVDDGVFSASSLAESALLYELAAGDDGQPADDAAALVGVTIYALEDIGAAVDFLKRNGVTIRHSGQTYLEAYVPVGLLGQASTQPDVIRVEPMIEPWLDQTMMDPCIEDLGTLSASASSSGSWTNECASENRTGRYARYYSFTLAADSVVTIDLTSSDANAYLYLMRGVDKSGAIVASDDDGGNGRNSRIARALQPGQYTIEATTSSGTAIEGSFELAIDTTALTFCEYEDLGTISGSQRLHRYGPWSGMESRGCNSVNRMDGHARHYRFTLAGELVCDHFHELFGRGRIPLCVPHRRSGAVRRRNRRGRFPAIHSSPGHIYRRSDDRRAQIRRRHQTRNPDVSDPYHNEQCTFGARSAYMERTWLRWQWHKGGHHRRGIRQLRQGWRGGAADHQG